LITFGRDLIGASRTKGNVQAPTIATSTGVAAHRCGDSTAGA
jgi:hypothetical protein